MAEERVRRLEERMLELESALIRFERATALDRPSPLARWAPWIVVLLLAIVLGQLLVRLQAP
jgi:hypothetical protein